MEAENGYSSKHKGEIQQSKSCFKGEKIGELKAGVVKDKPLIHTAEEHKDEPILS